MTYTYMSVEPTVKPILPPLAEAIRRTLIGLKTFIVTSRSQQFSKKGSRFADSWGSLNAF